jgi:hypothetical protein
MRTSILAIVIAFGTTTALPAQAQQSTAPRQQMQPNQKVQDEADKGIKTRNAGESGKGNTKRGAESEEDWRMDSAQHCYDQAAECP